MFGFLLVHTVELEANLVDDWLRVLEGLVYSQSCTVVAMAGFWEGSHPSDARICRFECTDVCLMTRTSYEKI